MHNDSVLSRRSLLRAGAALGISQLGCVTPVHAEAVPINIASTRGNATVTIQELMRRKGYLEEFGIRPKVTFVVDGTRLLGSLLSGESDICAMSGISQVIPAIEKGAKVKFLAGALVKPEHAVYTKRSDVRSLKDLSGKTVGTGSVGALLYEMMVALFQKYDMDYRTIQFVNVGSASDVFRAVVAGTVDAGISEIDVFNSQSKYGVHVIEEGELWKQLPQFTFQGTYASDDTIKRKREDLVRVLAAYAKLYRFLSTPESKEEYIAAQAAALGHADRAAAEWQWQFFKDAQVYATDLLLSKERLDYMQDLNKTIGIQKSKLAYDRLADMSLAQDAIKLLSSQ